MGIRYGFTEPIQDDEFQKLLEQFQQQQDELEQNPDEFLTWTDVAGKLRTQNPVAYAGYTDEQVYNQAVAYNPKIKDYMWEPSIAEITDVQGEIFKKLLFKDMPAFAGIVLSGGADEALSEEQARIKKGLEAFGGKEALFERTYKSNHPDASEEDYQLAWEGIQKDEEGFKNWSKKLLVDGRDGLNKYFEENPEAMATIEWLAGKDLTEGDFNFKYIYSILAGVVPSLLVTSGAGATGGLIQGAVTSVGGPYAAAAGGVSGWAIGEFLAGATMEGGAHLAEGFKDLTSDKMIPKGQFDSEVGEYWEEIKNDKPMYDETLKRNISPEDRIKKYIADNYKIDEKKNVVKLGMNDYEAMDLVTPSAITVGVVNGIIEMWSDIPMAARRYTPKSFKRFLPSRIYAETLQRAEKSARKIPKVEGVLNKFKAFGAAMPIRFVTDGAAESMEEVFQTLKI